MRVLRSKNYRMQQNLIFSLITNNNTNFWFDIYIYLKLHTHGDYFMIFFVNNILIEKSSCYKLAVVFHNL